MALIHLPQTKWASGTGRQAILKGDFDKIEQAVVESFELTLSPSLEHLSDTQAQVNATADCKARVMLTGFPSPLHRGIMVDAGLSDGRYRENAAPATLDVANPGSLWGTAKASQWYCVYAVAGSGDTTSLPRTPSSPKMSSSRIEPSKIRLTCLVLIRYYGLVVYFTNLKHEPFQKPKLLRIKGRI